MQCRFMVAASLVGLSLIFGMALTAPAQMPDKPLMRPRITGISCTSLSTRRTPRPPSTLLR